MNVDRATAAAFRTVALVDLPFLRFDKVMGQPLRNFQKDPGLPTVVIAELELSCPYSTSDDRTAAIAAFGHAIPCRADAPRGRYIIPRSSARVVDHIADRHGDNGLLKPALQHKAAAGRERRLRPAGRR